MLAMLMRLFLHLNRHAAIYRSILSIFGIFILVLICLAGAFIASVLAIARPMCKVRHVVQDVHAMPLPTAGSIGTCCAQCILGLRSGAFAAKMPHAQSAACTA